MSKQYRISKQIEQKYRPVLTVDHINTIVSLCSSELQKAYSQDVLDVLRIFKPLKAKIDTETLSITEYMKLPDTELRETASYYPELRETAYKKYLLNPEECTLKEIEDANTYRYENDLMSKEEEREYEKYLEISDLDK